MWAVPLLACMSPRAYRAPDSENGDDDRPPKSQNVVLCYVMLCHVMSYLSCYIMSCYVMSCYVKLNCTIQRGFVCRRGMEGTLQ